MRRAVSGTVIAIVAVVVVVVVAAGAYFALGMGGSTNTSTTTTSTGGGTTTGATPPTGSLNSSIGAFVNAFNNRDVTTIKTYFTSSSQIDWTGASGGLGGTYQGSDGAGIVYGASVGHTSSLSAKASDIKTTSTGPTTSTVTYSLNITGVSNVIGKFNSTVAVSQNWAYQSGSWVIQADNWNYLTFSSNNPSQATVFPQWGLTLNGKPPSLAGEHVVEWNLAPYLAVGVYGVIVVLGLAIVWVKIRGQKR